MRTPEPLTGRQWEIYSFIYQHARDKGYQPSVREVCDHFGFVSTNSITEHLLTLAKKGYLLPPRKNVVNSTTRSIRFLRRPDGKPFTGFRDKE